MRTDALRQAGAYHSTTDTSTVLVLRMLQGPVAQVATIDILARSRHATVLHATAIKTPRQSKIVRDKTLNGAPHTGPMYEYCSEQRGMVPVTRNVVLGLVRGGGTPDCIPYSLPCHACAPNSAAIIGGGGWRTLRIRTGRESHRQ